ncbi:MAG: polyprenol monophosphomannose synthase [Candidatus Helarchaeota archaeon]
MNEKISIVLPTYNEIDNIEKVITSIQQVLERNRLRYEIIVVDDNSPDGTGKFAKALAEKNSNLKVIIRKEKTGLGDAYKHGFRYVTGDIIFQMDADLSHNPEDIPNFIKAIKYGYGDVIIGSRYIEGGGNLNRNKTRIVISKVANILASFFFRLYQTDCTTGYRAYRREVIDTIMPHVNCQKYVFLVEMLEKTKMFNYKVCEIPIKFQDRYNGESKFNIREVLEFLRELARKFLQRFFLNRLFKRPALSR